MTKINKHYCSKCNRCLTSEKGTTITGFQLEINGLDKSPQIREQLGKYAPEGNYVIFRFCYQCWLDSMFNDSPYFEGFAV